jgi:hypothetical protein
MNIHFHYYCVRVLARAAGFSNSEAEIIAYASQYVDDATEHKALQIDDVPPEADEQHISGRYEPICTAHSGLQYATSWMTAVQRKVYIPFHFVPGKPHTTGKKFDYRVKPGGAIATSLVDAGLSQLEAAPKRSTERTRALIKTGIALHTYADTWAHQRFSGRHSSSDNDIGDRARQEKGKWRSVGMFEVAALNAAPDIGHAEAGVMPDTSHLSWRYRHEKSGQLVSRDNTAEFMKAADRILRKLCGVTGERATMPAGVRSCLLQDNDSSKVWRKAFPNVFTQPSGYDRARWRKQALTHGNVFWDHYNSARDFEAERYTFNGDLKWFLFHAEAGIQRDRVLRSIRYDLE